MAWVNATGQEPAATVYRQSVIELANLPVTWVPSPHKSPL